MLHCGWLVPENSCTTCNCSGSEFVVNHNAQLVPKLLPSASVFVPILVNGQLNGTHRVFHMCRGHITSTKCTPSRGTTSPYATQGIFKLYHPFPRAPHCFLAGASPGKDLQNFRLCTPLFIKTWWYCNPLLFPHQWFWVSFFV